MENDGIKGEQIVKEETSLPEGQRNEGNETNSKTSGYRPVY